MSAAQRAVAAALLFLGAATLAGVALVAGGVEYRAFGMVEAVFALLLSYVLVQRGAWTRPADVPGWVAVAYGTVANAQVLELLLPPPGVVEWGVVGALAVAAWAALGRGSPHRLVVSLGGLALLLAALKFSFLPVMVSGLGPEPGTAFGLGDVAERARRFVADAAPLRPAGQLVGALALGLWALGTRLLWTEAPRREAARGP